MADKTGIAWTDSTWTTRGCSVVSPGCTNCYAMKTAHRFPAYEGLTEVVKGSAVWNGKIKLVEKQLDQPLRWRKPRRIFVDSMSDLFHEGVPAHYIERVWDVMAQCPQHTFQILTKRAERMERLVNGGLREHFASGPWPLPNVHLGVSTEDQPRYHERVPPLLATDAAVRFVSMEPLIGAIDVSRQPGEIACYLDGLGWGIVGGESGARARACYVEWITKIVGDFRAANVPLFVKQLGSHPVLLEAELAEWGSGVQFTGDGIGSNRGRVLLQHRKGGHPPEWPARLRVQEFPDALR